jgi:hypothetical protein
VIDVAFVRMRRVFAIDFLLIDTKTLPDSKSSQAWTSSVSVVVESASLFRHWARL